MSGGVCTSASDSNERARACQARKLAGWTADGLCLTMRLLEQHGNPARVGIGQWPQQDRIDEREDRRVDADADRERQQRDAREAWTLQ